MIVEAIRKTIPLKSETLVLSITVPAQSAAHTFSVLKGAGNLKDQQWLSDGSLRSGTRDKRRIERYIIGEDSLRNQRNG